jgi:signal transduction histidine kinase
VQANRVANPTGVLVAVGAVTATALPLVSLALSAVERRRLRLVDTAPAPSRHRPLAVFPLRVWLATRCWERATWWEVAYAVLFWVALAPFDLMAGTMLVVASLGLVAIPFYDLLYPGSAFHTLGRDHLAGGLYIDSVAQEVVVGLVGLLLLVPAACAAVGLAWARGMVARLLLVGPGDQALTDRLRALTRSRSRMVDAFDAEQRRIERDLHDGAQQRLTAMMVTLGLADMELEEGPPAARALVRKASGEALEALAELRRLVQGIHPPVLTSRGLAAALDELAERTPVPVDLYVELPPRRPPAALESAAYFVAAEALVNVAKHSGAARAWISVRAGGGWLRLEIGDDGAGGADPERGSGLVGLSDRVSALDGRIELSSPAGGPTVVRVELPWAQMP